MSEIWLVASIFVRPEKYEDRDKILLEVVRPSIKKLEALTLQDKPGMIESFHFLFYDHEVRLRIRTGKREYVHEISTIIRSQLANTQSLVRETKFDDDSYHGEQGGYGDEGWDYVQKFFECNSRMSLLRTEALRGEKPAASCQLEIDFNEAKLIHCFLNSWGYDIGRESLFHGQASIERLLMLHNLLSKRLDSHSH